MFIYQVEFHDRLKGCKGQIPRDLFSDDASDYKIFEISHLIAESGMFTSAMTGH